MGELPEGFLYLPDFISPAEERQLLDDIARLEFSEVRMHGVAAKRRVIHFGWVYGYDSWRITPGASIPQFLEPLRARLGELVAAEPEALAEALVTEYSPGAAIGWHRDAPMFGVVVAVSLLGSCRLRFRRGEVGARETSEIRVEPRSAYVLTGIARSAWQHSIPPAETLRYSITFRTIKKRPKERQ
jgi:alkylated DNA repair dioxygenase AlkB